MLRVTFLCDGHAEILSGRQREVLQLVADGYSAKEIGKLLGISYKTVESNKGLIRKKLDLHSTAELTQYATVCKRHRCQGLHWESQSSGNRLFPT